MTHDYGERMSLMLDGRLSVHERAELEAHLAVCGECRIQWLKFQHVDRVFAGAAMVAPVPGFARRLAARLVREQALQARRVKRERTIAWVGVLAAGSAALVLLIAPVLIGAWVGVNDLFELAPSLFVGVVGEIARWLVTLNALGEAGRTVLSTLLASGGSILLGYALILLLVTSAWAWVMKGVSKRWGRLTGLVLVW